MPGPRKVRCPKCTALLSEPPYPVFECPICSTLLLAKGAPKEFLPENSSSAVDTAEAGSSNHVEGNIENGQTQHQDATENEEGSTEKNDHYGKLSENVMEERYRVGWIGEVTGQQSHVSSEKEADEESKTWTEDEQVKTSNIEADKTGPTKGHPLEESEDGKSKELENDDSPMSSAEMSRGEVAENVELSQEKKTNDNGAEKQRQFPDDNELGTWDGQSTDHESIKNASITSLIVSSHNLVGWTEKERETHDSFMLENELDDKVVDQPSLEDAMEQEGDEQGDRKEDENSMTDGNMWSLQAQFFQKREYELSFKYSLASPETKDQLSDSKSNENSGPACVPAFVLRNDTSDTPLQGHPKGTPSQFHGGSHSSQQNEDERPTSRFISSSHEESESDFDFPAPQLQKLQDVRLPVPFIKRKNSYPNSGAAIGPHTLELRNVGSNSNLEISKGKETETEGQLHTLAAESNGVDSAVESWQSDDMILIDGSSQQLPGTVRTVKSMEVSTSAKETMNGENTGKQRIGPVQHNPDQSKYGNDTELDNISSNVSTLHENLSSEDRQMQDTSSSLIQNDAGKIHIVKDGSSPAPSTKDRGAFFKDKAAFVLAPRSPPRGRRNLPSKLQAYDSEGRLLLKPRPENKNRTAHADGLAATGETLSQPGSTFGSPDLYDIPSNQASHELNPSHYNGIGFPVTPRAPGYIISNHHPMPSKNTAYPYQQASLHPLMVTVPMQEQYAFAHHGYHPATAVCVLCMHHQHPQIPHSQCTPCFNHPVSMMHQPAHGDPWNYCYRGHSRTASSAGGSQTYFPSKPKADLSSTTSSPRLIEHFPPLPKDGAAPYIVCKACSAILKVPPYLLHLNGNIIQKLRCGDCGKISKFSVRQEGQQLQAKASVVAKGKLPMLDGIQKDMSVMNQAQILAKNDPVTGVGATNTRNFVQDPGPSTNHARYVDSSSSPNRGFKVVAVVDEEEEGLDFGAPRLSDGDSLDQSESRTRSPENQGNFAGVDAWQYADLEKEEGATRAPLLALLNQGSQKFSIDLYPHEHIDSYSLSASESPSYDQLTYGKHHHGTEAKSHGHISYYSLRKGPKYIAGLLRRSLRDIGKGQ